MLRASLAARAPAYARPFSSAHRLTRVAGLSSATAPARSQSSSTGSSNATEKPLFDKILIANRGEIACRVIRTARRMGIKTVAIYSEADWDAKHVRMADEAVLVGPPPAAQSYIVMDKVLDAVAKTGAQAVHPGYGFLSENCRFAEALEKAGVAFIGPRRRAIEAMGDKIESKLLAKRAGVNTIPGVDAVLQDVEEAVKIAREIGYPVMIKASAGGGGKGMRIAWNDDEVRQGYRLSREEAKASFGDDRMFIEKYIDNPRHIEIQVLADSFGNTFYLAERECSIQRRNQKVIEEAPSPFLDRATRAAMGAQACQLAKAVQYQSAGTVEFLVDRQRNFYFLEMNTRLQVEHPITEFVTGVDLVEQMIRVAAGEKLALRQEELEPKGWAFESRVYAEDPHRSFLPSIGRLSRYTEPHDVLGALAAAELNPYGSAVAVEPLAMPHVRCDSGVFEGSEISMYYDPMICKLVTYGPDRPTSLATMRDALDAYVIRGVGHNIPFLRALTEHPRFLAGDLSTKFIPEEYPAGFKGHSLTREDWLRTVAVAAGLFMEREEKAVPMTRGAGPYVTERLASYVPTAPERLVVALAPAVPAATEILGPAEAGRHQTVVEVVDRFLESPSGVPKAVHCLRVDGEEIYVETRAAPGQPNVLEASFWRAENASDRQRQLVQLLGVDVDTFAIQVVGQQLRARVEPERVAELRRHMRPAEAGPSADLVVSPMPGSLHSVAVKPGETVFEGQEVAVVEAMKMQNVIRAPRAGLVKRVAAAKGATLAVDQLILELEPAAPAP